MRLLLTIGMSWMLMNLFLETKHDMNTTNHQLFGMVWKRLPAFPSRQALIEQLDEDFDLMVIGGGATGSGVSLDAASRGLRVVMLEQEDFASGTSSRSTKLLHGGVRYLKKAMQTFDLSQFHLVREALHERWILFNQAPHLTNMLPIITPMYSWGEIIPTFIQLKLYDWIAIPHSQ